MPCQPAVRFALSALFVTTLAACGGGGDSDPSAVSASPQPSAADGTSGAGSTSGTGNDADPSGTGTGTSSSTDPATAGGSAPPSGATAPVAAAFGQGLRDRLLTTLAGSAALNCDNGASFPTLALDAGGLQLGPVTRPVSALTSVVAGRIYDSATPPGLLDGDQFRIQLRFDDAGSTLVYELRFSPDGQLADLVIGAPNVDDDEGDRALVAGTSFCKPTTGTAWNANPALKISPTISYELISERQPNRAARSLACRTVDGVAPETWNASVRVENGVTWSSPRPADSGGTDYRYGPDDYDNHYTVIHGDNLVTHWDRVVPGGLQWGYGLTLGHDEEIVGMEVVNRPGAPWTQICGTN